MFAEHRPQASEPEFWADHFRAHAVHVSRSWYRRLFAWNRHFGDPRWRAIRRWIHPGGRILDAGCGVGQWVSFLGDQGYRAEGLDYSPELVEMLRQFFPNDRWIAGPVQAMPVESESVDGLISWGVIEHDPAGPQAALVEIRRVLKRGGVAVMTVPRDSRAMRQAVGTGASDGPFYQFLFDEASLRGEVEKAGFEVVAIRPTERHMAVAFPTLYARIRSRGHLFEALFGLVLRPVLMLMPESASMLMVVVSRPETS